MKFQKLTLQNGIRLIHSEVKSKVAHLALLVNTGSRDENEDEHGVAHFIEHTLFKGTKKRKAYQINSRLDNSGGELNAYTTKEETCVQATFLQPDYDKAIELISDIVFNSTFPEKEIIKEREIIIDEINSYKDSPSEQIFDDFEDLIFQNSYIGRNILGTPESLKTIDRERLRNFVRKNYNTDEIVICSIGNLSFKKFCAKVNKYFADYSANPRTHKRSTPEIYKPQSRELDFNTHQAHCIIGCRAYNINEPKQYPFLLLNNILGGPGLNSRLNNIIREKHGLVYNVESNFNSYSDTGVFSIYLGTDIDYLDKCQQLIYSELKRLRDKKLSIRLLKQAKRQLSGQIIIAYEQNEAVMLAAAKKTLQRKDIRTLDDIISMIENITAEEIIEVANEIFQSDDFTTLIYR